MIETPPVLVRRATVADADALATFGRRQFAETFGAHNDPGDLAAYLDGTYNAAVQGAELADPRVRVLVAEVEGAWAAYALVSTRGAAPVAVSGDSPWQIERFYVDRAYHGQGLSDALMDAALDIMANGGAQVVWLSVWERNARAIAFYKRRGFTDVGSAMFTVGSDAQLDRVLARPVRDRRITPLPRSTVRRPALLVRLQRGREGRDFVAGVRADGSSCWLRRPGGMPRSDRALVAVEATLNLEQGVFALVAAGADLAEFLLPAAAARADAAGWVVRLATVLDAESASPHVGGAAKVTAALGRPPEGAPLLDDALLLALRGALARLDVAWRGLAADDALEFPFGVERVGG